MADQDPTEPEQRKLVISAAGSVRSKGKLEKRERTWQQLLDLHFSKSTMWNGTRDEFLAKTKAAQDKIKDIGYFVGGEFKDERRLQDEVVGRDLLTLDGDYAGPDFIANTRKKLKCAWAVYSTIKHHEKKPRYRLCVPLARTVTPDEYEPIARKLAEALGIDQFDDTTYQVHRAMFWPMHCRDVEPVFEVGEGPLLNPDNILARYLDWHNTIEWPKSSRQDKVLARRKQKAGEPSEKPGIIGAFCRTFSVAEAIEEFLGEVYTHEGGDRYTYKKGSTSNGAIVYEDKWLYSWHGTDPTSAQLVNAFDLVRLHRFTTLDSESAEDTPINKLPSYQAMCDLAREHPSVKQQAMADQIRKAQLDFDDFDESGGVEWGSELDRDRKNRILGTAHNVAVLLKNAPGLTGKIRFNRLADRLEVAGDLPWRQRESGQWGDVDAHELRAWLFKNFDMDAKILEVHAGVDMMQVRNAYDPLIDYLDPLEWDGVPRLEDVLVRHLGAEDTPLTRAMTRKWFVQGVLRAYQPGAKADHMLLLSGAGGIGKSNFARLICGGLQWFGENPPPLKDTREIQQWIQGKWVVELSELSSLRKAEVEHVKAFLSQMDDSFRKSYGRNVNDKARRCVFLGTTNEDTPLKDATGNRRFWLVACHGRLNPEALEREVDQLWAEAKMWWQLGERCWLDTPELEEAFDALERTGLDDPWGIAEIIQEYIDEPVPVGWYDSEPGAEFGGETEPRRYLIPAEIRQWIRGRIPEYRGNQNRDIAAAIRKIGGWRSSPNAIRTGKRFGRARVFYRLSDDTSGVAQ